MKFPKLNSTDMGLWLLQFSYNGRCFDYSCAGPKTRIQPPAEWEWLIKEQQNFPKKDQSSPSPFILAGEMSRLSSLPSILPCIFFNQIIMSQTSFLSKEKHPTLQHSNFNHLQKQWTKATQHMRCCLANRWEGSLPLGCVGCPRCAVSVALCSWLLHQQLTMPGTQVQLLVRQCVLALGRASSKPCDRSNLLEQEFLTCPLLAEEINHKDTQLGKKELQALFISSPLLPALGREQLLLKKRGFIFCHVRCHGFFLP